MNFNNSFRLLFLIICAIHLGKCDYPSGEDLYPADEDYPLMNTNKNAGGDQNQATQNPNEAPKDFLIPKVSFVPYSSIETVMAVKERPKAAPKAQAKKKPCPNGSQQDNQGGSVDYRDYGDGSEGDDNDDSYDAQHSEEDAGRQRRSHRKPALRAHRTQISSEGHSFHPKVREIINKYSIDLVENNDRY